MKYEVGDRYLSKDGKSRLPVGMRQIMFKLQSESGGLDSEREGLPKDAGHARERAHVILMPVWLAEFRTLVLSLDHDLRMGAGLLSSRTKASGTAVDSASPGRKTRVFSD